MPVAERLEKLIKIAGSLAAISVVAAQLLTNIGDRQKPVHLATYLIGRAWPEVLVITVVSVALYLSRRRVRWLSSDVLELIRTYRWTLLRTPRYAIPVALILIMGAQLIVPVWYGIRTRARYWQHIVLDEYVSTYEYRVDVLAARGRIRDALALAKLVRSSTGNLSIGTALDGRIMEAGTAIGVSERLAGGRTGQWNAVTERAHFFDLVEAVRRDPQNYRAADLVDELEKRLKTQFIPADAKAICSSIPLDQFRGFATSTIEAQIRRLEAAASHLDCASVQTELGRAWMLAEVDCVNAVSASTRRSADVNELTGSPVQISGCTDFAFPPIESRVKRDYSWWFPTLAYAGRRVVERVRSHWVEEY